MHFNMISGANNANRGFEVETVGRLFVLDDMFHTTCETSISFSEIPHASKSVSGHVGGMSVPCFVTTSL